MLPPNTCLQCTIFDQQNIHIKLLQSSLFLSPRNQYCMNVHCSRSGGITFSCQALALLCEHSLAWEAWCGPGPRSVLCCPSPGQCAHRSTEQGTLGWHGYSLWEQEGGHTLTQSRAGVCHSLVTVQCPVCTHCPHSPALTCQFPGQPRAPQHPPHSSHCPWLGQPCTLPGLGPVPVPIPVPTAAPP